METKETNNEQRTTNHQQRRALRLWLSRTRPLAQSDLQASCDANQRCNRQGADALLNSAGESDAKMSWLLEATRPQRLRTLDCRSGFDRF